MKKTFFCSALASAILCPMVLTSCGPSGSSANSTSGENPDASATTAPVVTNEEASTIPAVDLGLSVKWAPQNVGADKPEDYGRYYAWGETKGMGEEDTTNERNYLATDSCYVKNLYNWATYKYCNGSGSSLTKYCVNDGKTMLELDDDAARDVMGGTWRVPTSDELAELREKCTWTWTEVNGVKGYNVVGPNGNSIFLPAAGARSNQSRGLVADKGPIGVGESGDYWSSNIGQDNNSELAWRLIFGEKVVSYTYKSRCEGATIRAVCE